MVAFLLILGVPALGVLLYVAEHHRRNALTPGGRFFARGCVLAFGVSLGLIGLGHFQPGVAHSAEQMLKDVHFDEALMQVMLSFLLFAGALHIDLNELLEQKWPISVLALGGVDFDGGV